jgi:hypothetical protein
MLSPSSLERELFRNPDVAALRFPRPRPARPRRLRWA